MSSIFCKMILTLEKELIIINLMTFGSRLKIYRDRAKLHKSDLALKLGCSPSYIANLETGRKKPPIYDFCIKLFPLLNLNQKEKLDMLNLAFKGRLSEEDQKFIDTIGMPTAVGEDISKALKDPIALRALLEVYRSSANIKEDISSLLSCISSISIEKRTALIALCK